MSTWSVDQNVAESQPGVAELPFDPDRLIVVSDLHLAAGKEPATGRCRLGENFLADDIFHDMLRYFQAIWAGQSRLLVLNGDTFDFVRIDDLPEREADFLAWQASLRALGVEKPLEELRDIHPKEERYGLRTDDYKSVWKFDRIARGHSEFFQGLAEWVSEGGTIAFVKGNHDVELFWPLVQRAIRRSIAEHADPRLVDERVLFVQGGLRVGNIYLEHGHQFERTTAVKGGPVLDDDPTELNLPLGSFVNRYLINSLERLEPFLDNARPVDRTLTALLKRHPLRVFGILARSLPFLRRAARPYWLREWLAFFIFFASLALPILTIGIIVLAIFWSPLVAGIPSQLRPILSVGGLIAPWIGGILRDLILRPKPFVGEDGYAAGMYQRLTRISFDAEYQRVYGVLGHTHNPDVQELPPLFGSEALVVNTGTWIPLWPEERPDLLGRVIYSLVVFSREPTGEYRHQYFEWRPEAGRPQPATLFAPRATIETRGFLTAGQLATVKAFAEVFIAGKNEVLTPEEIAANIDAHLARVRTKRTATLRMAFVLVEYFVPLLSGRWRFSRQTPAVRRAIIERRLAGDRGGALFRNLAKIRTLFAVGYYGSERVFESIGFLPVNRRPRNLPPNPALQPLGLPRLPIRAPSHHEQRIKADLCVIGSGAGGAVIAALAAQSGRRVVLLEEGRYFHRALLSHREPIMSAMLYKESGLQSTVDLGMTILQGRALGGTTVINNHICFRLNDPMLDGTLPDTIGEWARVLHVNLDVAALGESFERVTKEIKVAPIGDDIVGGNGRILLDGWRALQGQTSKPGFPSGRFSKNLNPVPGQQCAGCGYCNFGCPYERKLSMLETYVTDAYRHGARVVTECHAQKIVRDGRRAVGVEAILGDGRPFRVDAEQIVVAGGAIGSSVLLLKSGFDDPPVGSRFSFNAATPMAAKFPQRIDGFDGDQMATFIDAGDALLESAFNPPMAFAIALPGWFEVHFDRMRDYPHFASAGVVIATAPTGRVKRRSFTRNLFGPVAYRMGKEEFKKLRKGMSILAQTYFAAGAEYVLPASLADHPLEAKTFAPSGWVDADAIDEFLNGTFAKPEMLTLNSSHPQGGNPMSDDRRIGVVDSRFKVHGTDNLFVCDASVFPTSIRINPQLTIMAFADYAWHRSISGED